MDSLVYPMRYLSSYNTSQTLHKCQYVMCLLWNVVFAQRGACELSKAGRIKIFISFGVTLCMQNHAYIYIYIYIYTLHDFLLVLFDCKKRTLFTLLHCLFTASDYLFGTFCSRLLIIPLVSSVHGF